MDKIKKYAIGHVLFELDEAERFVFGFPYILLDGDLKNKDNIEFVSEYVRNEIWRYNPFCNTVREADLTVEALNYRNQLETLKCELKFGFKNLMEDSKKAKALAERIKSEEENSMNTKNVGKITTALKDHFDLGGGIKAGTKVEIVSVSQHGYTIRDVENGSTVKDIGFLI